MLYIHTCRKYLTSTGGYMRNYSMNIGIKALIMFQNFQKIQVEGQRVALQVILQDWTILADLLRKNINGKYNLQTILKPLFKEEEIEIDKYRLLNDYISYLQNDSINGNNLSALSIKAYIVRVKSYLAYNDIEISPNKFKNKVNSKISVKQLQIFQFMEYKQRQLTQLSKINKSMNHIYFCQKNSY